MKDAVIYVAGDPNAYPVEYYDEETGAYQGMIPELLRQFSEEYGYDVRYYEPEKGDQREDLAENKQVDLITASGGDQAFLHRSGGEVVLLTTEQNGKSVVYQLLVTDVAPKELAGDLRSFLSGVSQSARTGLLIESAEREQFTDMRLVQLGAVAAGVAILTLAAVIAALARQYRRRIRNIEIDKETDEVTGIGNQAYLERNSNLYLNDQNKILYRLLYFYIDTEELDRRGSRSMTDEYLRNVAVTLQERTGDMDILTRVSDSGFVLLRLSMDDQEEQEWLRPVMERLRNTPAGLDMTQKRFFAVGSYQLKSTDRDLYGTIFDASQCAKAAYLDGDEFRKCTDEVIETLTEERQFQADMRHGLENNEFLLYLQLYVDSHTGQIIGGEALSRWDHPTRGLLMPADFLPMMEREHLVSKLDMCCLENACEFLQRMTEEEKQPWFFVSCNFSMDTFSAPDFMANCRRILDRYRFPKNLLIFELRDAVFIRSAKQVEVNIQQIKTLGVCVSLDDFGGLFASLADVQDIPVDFVKISRPMVRGVGSRSGESILKGMIRVCRELGFGVMAEGVETTEQAQFLSNLQCEALQGFYFYRPVPEWEARKMIREGAAYREDAETAAV